MTNIRFAVTLLAFIAAPVIVFALVSSSLRYNTYVTCSQIQPGPPPDTKNLPIYPSATLRADTTKSILGGHQRVIKLETTASAADVLKYYRAKLEQDTWERDEYRDTADQLVYGSGSDPQAVWSLEISAKTEKKLTSIEISLISTFWHHPPC